MSRQRTIFVTTVIVFLVLVTVTLAQRGRWRRGWDRWDERDERGGVPMWENEAEFASDVFTFARVQYSSYGRRGRWRGRGDWATDYPDSDLNFSFRLQQLTSFKVNPNPVTVRLTDDALFDYPFIYMVEPGALEFTPEEVVALRRYLLNGGFLMVDDFWGDYEYENFYEQIKRVFPDREPEELDLSHWIFNCVYRLKEKPQVPSITNAQWGASRGITWEPGHGGDCQTVHYKQIKDDKERMVVLICHNTDLGDGWEREGEDEWYFREFAEKKSYPMGINIITYAMTH